MQINFNRICKLAGLKSVEGKVNSAQTLSEGNRKDEEPSQDISDDPQDEKSNAPDEDSLVEVDINELMSEIRRAKKLMKINNATSKQKASSKKVHALQEAHLKRIIQKEITNILDEIDKMDMQQHSWVYGNNAPKRSKQGRSALHQLLPSIGFHTSGKK